MSIKIIERPLSWDWFKKAAVQAWASHFGRMATDPAYHQQIEMEAKEDRRHREKPECM